MKEPHFSIIGTGAMAARMMATFARRGVRVSAVVSNDPRRALQFARYHKIDNAYNTLAELLRNPNIDVVYIANASSDHAATAISALTAGKAVLCEKPLAVSLDQCQQLADTAKHTGLLCMEAIFTQFLPAHRNFIALANSNTFGTPTHLSADFGYPTNKMKKQLPRGGNEGVLLDRGIYLLALAAKIFGHVERVDAKLTVDDEGVDRHATLQLIHSTGGRSQLSASSTSLLSNHATLACERGNISLEAPLIGAEIVSTRHFSQSRHANYSKYGKLKQGLLETLRKQQFVRQLKRVLPISHATTHSYGADQYMPQLEHFLSLLESGERESSIIPLDFSLELQKLIAMARADHDR